MTEEQLENHLAQFEVDLLEKVSQINNHKRSWLYNNVSVIVTGLVIIIGGATAWGVNSERIVAIVDRQSSIERHITDIQIQIRLHHEDFNRHVDSDWKNRVMNQLQEIQGMIARHMARDIR